MERRTYNQIILITSVISGLASLATLGTTFGPVFRLAPNFMRAHITLVFLVGLLSLVVSIIVFMVLLNGWHMHRTRHVVPVGVTQPPSGGALPPLTAPMPTATSTMMSSPYATIPIPTPNSDGAHRFPAGALLSIAISMVLLSLTVVYSTATHGTPLPGAHPIVLATGKATAHPTPTRTPRVTHKNNRGCCTQQGSGSGGYVPAYSSQATGNPGSLNAIPDQLMGVSLTFKNTGRDTWSGSGFTLICDANSSCYQLATGSIALGSASVAPGRSYTFYLSFGAPTTPGVYTVGWIMAHDTTPFGADNHFTITVSPDTNGQATPTTLPTDAPTDTPTALPAVPTATSVIPTDTPAVPTATPIAPASTPSS